MSEHGEVRNAGVVCLHCGSTTPLPKSVAPRTFLRLLAAASHISLIRCTNCGREAPYLPADVVALEKASKPVSCAA